MLLLSRRSALHCPADGLHKRASYFDRRLVPEISACFASFVRFVSVLQKLGVCLKAIRGKAEAAHPSCRFTLCPTQEETEISAFHGSVRDESRGAGPHFSGAAPQADFLNV